MCEITSGRFIFLPIYIFKSLSGPKLFDVFSETFGEGGGAYVSQYKK